MDMMARRSFHWRYGQFHAPLTHWDYGELPRSGAAVLLGLSSATQPVAPVGPTWGNRWYAGMDPTDPTTFIRPYRPCPGMIDYLNYDGAAASTRPGRAGAIT